MNPDLPLVDEADRAALRLAVAALDEAERHRRPIDMLQALRSVARCYRRLQALASAEASLEAALRWARAAQLRDGEVDLLCELAEVAVHRAWQDELRQRGGGRAARERARDHAFAARGLAARMSDPYAEVHVLLCVGDVLVRCGDHDDAEQIHARALSLMSLPEVTEIFDSANAPLDEV
jgi:tetratricopeptide (TPR) repeat protein